MALTDKSPVLLPYQRKWLGDRSPMKIWLASRQVGKSFALSLEAVAEAVEARCNNLLLSSSERQSRELMQKVSAHLRVFGAFSPSLAPVRETAEEVMLKNGSRIVSLPANPDTVRGFSGNVFLDEFAFHAGDRGIWRAMYPTVTRGFKVRVSSTPNGMSNMFHALWSKSDGGFSRHKVDIYEAARQGLDVDLNRLRQGIGEPEAWAQEYECRFLDRATAYITYGMIGACEEDTVLTDLDTGTLSPGAELYLGVDIGRRHDLTVFWLLERVGDVLWTRMVRCLRDARFSLQRETLYALMDDAGVRRAAMDSTGLGTQLAEEASGRFGARVEPVCFTSAVKEDLAVTLRRAFEERALRIPSSPEIRQDIHSVKRSVTSAGNVRYGAGREGDGHADRFWALALAVHAAGGGSAHGPAYEALQGRSLPEGRGCF